MSSDSIYRNEHGEIITQAEYEAKMFRTARRYKVAVLESQYNMRGVAFATYPEALIKALSTDRTMLYVIPDHGMTDCLIPANKYEHYLGVYNELTGQHISWAKLNAVADEMRRRAKKTRTRVRV